MTSCFLNILQRCKAIIRLWGIQEARKRRIEREFQEAWAWNNRKIIRKLDRKMEKEVDDLYETTGGDRFTEWDELTASSTSSQHSFLELF